VSEPTESPFVTTSAGMSDRNLRDNNEDAFVIDESLGLYVVADGVGGHQAGEVASTMTVTRVREAVAAAKARTPVPPAAGVLSSAIETACREVYERAKSGPQHAGMGTTCTALLLEGDVAVMAHVGDSRLYLLRDAELSQISTDHTLAAELYRGGVISREKVDSHPHSHVLTRSIGSQSSVLVETLQLDLRPGDTYLLCSDGLAPALGRSDLPEIIERAGSLSEAVGQLIGFAKEDGASDNITAVLVRCHSETAPASSSVAALRSVPLLARLTTADLHRVAAEMTTIHPTAGTVLATRGEPTAGLFVVVDGTLRWALTAEDYALLERGAGIGQTTLLRGRRSPGQLTAETDAKVLQLSTSAFRHLVRRRPRLGNALLEGLADELSEWIDPDSDRGIPRPPAGLLVEF
jgi:serine/threonine protein phosphatase PrpC